MQGTIAVDRNPLGGPSTMTASDIGVGVDGHWNGEQVNAQFALVNGEGYSGGTGGFGKVTGTGADRNRYLGLFSYRTQQFTVAGEFVSVKNAAITGSIISAFGV